MEFDAPVRQQLLDTATAKDKKDGKAETGDEHEKSTRRKRKRDAGEEPRDVAMEMDLGSGAGSDSDSESDTSSTNTTDTSHPNPSADSSSKDQDLEQEYDFLLFHSHSSQPSPQKIILSTSDEPSGTGQILRPRPHSYFLAPKATGSRRAELDFAAVSGDDVRAERGRRHWGLEVPWRVRLLRPDGTLIPASRPPSKHPTSNSRPTDGVDTALGLNNVNNAQLVTLTDRADARSETGTRTKPNKKRRILLRERKRKRDVAEEARRKERESKEEAEKEKRTRRNREKKVKRRMKEKAKKMEAGIGGDAGGDAGGHSVGGEGGQGEGTSD